MRAGPVEALSGVRHLKELLESGCLGPRCRSRRFVSERRREMITGAALETIVFVESNGASWFLGTAGSLYLGA